MLPPPTRLRVASLALERGRRQLLSDLSFSLAPGQILHLKGANGSGKTTILRALAGLVTPAAGDLRWDEQPIQANARFRQALNYIGHQAALSADLSGRENLEFAVRLRPIQPRCTISQAIATVDASGFAERPCKQLSAGQKQRLALARLALFDCPLWMLDEPFTALDGDGRALLEGLINLHLEAQGLVVIATHQAFRVAQQPLEIDLNTTT